MVRTGCCCRPGFLLPVRVLSRLFRRLFLTRLADAHAAGQLVFFGELDGLRGREAFAAYLALLRRKNWFVYVKPPCAGPEAVLAYLARYTHRAAIANSRLVALDERGVTFRYKDYRQSGQARYRTMTLAPDEFIRRFLLHVLPNGFHRIRHYGLLTSATCKANIARQRTDRRASGSGGSAQNTTRTWTPAPQQTIARYALVAAAA
jgi:Putative transposase